MIVNYTDFYKVDHRSQYPKGTQKIYSNFTARGPSRIPGINGVVNFGLTYFIKRYLIDEFKSSFFSLPRDMAIANYEHRIFNALGPGAITTEHIGALWDLQYLPLVIKALPEGAVVPFQVPLFTVENTHPDFFWLTNFIETMISATVWPMCTSATIARKYREVFTLYAKETGADPDFVRWQGHDFSFRGMFGIDAAMMSGAGHLLSFYGTDTIPAIDFLERYYRANAAKEMIGGSVPATEHSVMCAGQKETESATYERLITKVYPKGLVSIVSDTWDFWNVVTQIIPSLKNKIMEREGKVVIRPDSGDPVYIIAGDPMAEAGTPEHKGLVECLWDTFGGPVTDKGYRVLDSHVGTIYGDSITLERQKDILEFLKLKKFASSNVVLGIGSYTYQHVTRDTFGFAMKSTYCEIDNKPYEIFKQPKTDSGKNSHRGLIAVQRTLNTYVAEFPVDRIAEETQNCLQPVFLNSKLLHSPALAEIRSVIDSSMPFVIKTI